MLHIHASELAATYKMTIMYFLVTIHINNQSTLYKVNGIVGIMYTVQCHAKKSSPSISPNKSVLVPSK
jgi:hypothetical protein